MFYRRTWRCFILHIISVSFFPIFFLFLYCQCIVLFSCYVLIDISFLKLCWIWTCLISYVVLIFWANLVIFWRLSFWKAHSLVLHNIKNKDISSSRCKRECQAQHHPPSSFKTSCIIHPRGGVARRRDRNHFRKGAVSNLIFFMFTVILQNYDQCNKFDKNRLY